jgi:dihydrofolate synthase/folylpolyglutamate synthase
VLTAAAFLYFAEQAVDIAVLETGLGGRLDSTNVVAPLVCGLTHISMDHMNILGRELTTIAREKAGIMKRNVPALSVEQEAAVAKVFEEVAQQVGAPLEFTGKQIDFSYRFEANRELGPHTRVSVITPTSRWEHLPVPLRGEHQAHNCALAMAMLDKLKGHGFTFADDKVIAALARTQLPGRMEQVWTEPRIIIDGAHNAASVQALIRSLGAHISYDSLILIFGCGQDKDVNGMLKQVALGADKIIFTKARTNPRAMEPESLVHRFAELSGKMAQAAPNLDEAIRLAGRAVTRDDLLVITGSFYLVGEAKKRFADLAAKRRRT